MAKMETRRTSLPFWGCPRSRSRTLNLNPRGLALGLAEGTILFKFTVPIHMPLMLFAIVSLFRRNHWVSAQEQAGRGQVQKAPFQPPQTRGIETCICHSARNALFSHVPWICWRVSLSTYMSLAHQMHWLRRRAGMWLT